MYCNTAINTKFKKYWQYGGKTQTLRNTNGNQRTQNVILIETKMILKRK